MKEHDAMLKMVWHFNEMWNHYCAASQSVSAFVRGCPSVHGRVREKREPG